MLKLVLKVLGALLFTLLVLEIGLRVAGTYKTESERDYGAFFTDYGHKLKNGHIDLNEPLSEFCTESYGEFNYCCETDEIGLKVQQHTGKDSIDVIVIGDSFVESVGADCDSGLVDQLAVIVQDSFPDLRLLNAGKSGSDVFYAAKLIPVLVDRYHPDRVVLNVNASDIFDVLRRGGAGRFLPGGVTQYRTPPINIPLYRYLHTWRFVVHNLRDIRPETLLTDAAYEALLERSKRDIIDEVAELQRYCESMDIRMITTFQPAPYFIHEDTVEANLEDLATLAADAGIRHVNLTPRFLEYRKRIGREEWGRYYWHRDWHFNTRGYKLFARYIYESVEEEYPGFFFGNASR